MTVTGPPEQLSGEGPYTLDKLSLPNAHNVNGREFPVAYKLNLNGADYDSIKVQSFLDKLAKNGTITKLIEDHAALVIRESILDSDESKADEIAQIIRAIEEGRGHVEFEQNGTLGLRDLKGYNLYTASKSPAENRILQHNEYSRFKRFPVTLAFTILDYTAIGGETPLVHGGELYQRVKREIPGFVEKLSEVGLQFKDEIWTKEPRKSDGLKWNHEVTFGRHIKPGDDLTTQKLKAEAIAKEFISENVRWDGDDNLLISSLTQPIKSFKGDPLIFSSIAAFSERYDPENPVISFGNGDKFNHDELKKYVKISEELEFKHAWKSGDIVLVHNYQVSHGKLPYYGGKRVTLVGMWDDTSAEKKARFVDLKSTI